MIVLMSVPGIASRQPRARAPSRRGLDYRMALRDYLALNEDGFRALFPSSPIKRIKRRGFLRNVCVALGTSGPRDLPALERAACDPEPLIAEHAAWAIDRILERIRHPAGLSQIT